MKQGTSADHTNVSNRPADEDGFWLTLDRYFLPLAVVAVGVALSLASFALILNSRTEALKRDFLSLAAQESALINDRFLLAQERTRGVLAFFQTAPTVDADRLERFTKPMMERVPFSMVGWLPAVSSSGTAFAVVQPRSGLVAESASIANIPAVDRAWRQAREARDLKISVPFTVPGAGGNRYLALLAPLVRTDVVQGFVFGLVDLNVLFDRPLRPNQAITYLFDKAAGDNPVNVVGGSPDQLNNSQRSERFLIDHSAFYYRLVLQDSQERRSLLILPTPQYMVNALDLGTWSVLVAGLTMTGLVGFATFQLAHAGIAVSAQVREQTQMLRGKENYLRAIVDNTVDGLITIDERGIVASFNPACTHIFGYEDTEVIGHNIRMLMPEPYHSAHDDYISHYVRTGEAKIIGTAGREVSGLRKDGSIFPMDLSISTYQLENGRYFSGVVRDITARQRADQERQNQIVELERINKELDDFAYVASHDLRSPLRAVNTLAQWIDHDDPSVDVETRKRLHLIQSRVQRMSVLLDDILDYARVGKSQGESGPQLSAAALIADVVATLGVGDHFNVISDPTLERVVVARMPIERVFHNLIGNAFKHHDKPDGTIQISVVESASRYRFLVVDDGPGFPSEYNDTVFEMFKTLKPRDEVESSGMGLALVRKIVRQRGGDCGVEASIGRGSRFWFEWPKCPDASG